MKRSSNFSGGSTFKVKKKNNEEDFLQMNFAFWLDKQGLLYTASCAGMKTHIRIASKMKAMGAKKGFPDILILEPRGQYHGLFMELKSSTGRASKEQKEWRDELNKRNYYSVIMPTGLKYEDGLQWCKDRVESYIEY